MGPGPCLDLGRFSYPHGVAEYAKSAARWFVPHRVLVIQSPPSLATSTMLRSVHEPCSAELHASHLWSRPRDLMVSRLLELAPAASRPSASCSFGMAIVPFSLQRASAPGVLADEARDQPQRRRRSGTRSRIPSLARARIPCGIRTTPPVRTSGRPLPRVRPAAKTSGEQNQLACAALSHSAIALWLARCARMRMHTLEASIRMRASESSPPGRAPPANAQHRAAWRRMEPSFVRGAMAQTSSSSSSSFCAATDGNPLCTFVARFLRF